MCGKEQGALYRRKAAGEKGKGSVALVLGAGNQTAVAAMDVLHKLVMHDAVVVCKMNPVNEWLGPYLRCALRVACCCPASSSTRAMSAALLIRAIILFHPAALGVISGVFIAPMQMWSRSTYAAVVSG